MTIPREKAVFRLDQNGRWYHGDEQFTNRKIIAYFHSRIRKDDDGYFLHQEHTHYIEKVYFPYEDTPLFVFRVIGNSPLVLCLNTGERISLDIEKLCVKNDHLYLLTGEELIKFNESSMMSLSDYMDEADGRYVIEVDGKRRVIPEIE